MLINALRFLQALNLIPASFRLTAGASANASVAGVVNVTNGDVEDLYNYIVEVQVDRGYEVGHVHHESHHLQAGTPTMILLLSSIDLLQYAPS